MKSRPFVCFRGCISASALLLLAHCLAISCTGTELKQKTVEAFDHYGAPLMLVWMPSFVLTVLSFGWSLCPNLVGNAFMIYSGADSSKYAKRGQKREANRLRFPMV